MKGRVGIKSIHTSAGTIAEHGRIDEARGTGNFGSWSTAFEPAGQLWIVLEVYRLTP